MFITIGEYELCDGTLSRGFAATDLRLRITRSIEVVQALGVADPSTYDRGTRTIDLSFTVTRVHASIKEAEVFFSKHENSVPQSGSVKLTSSNGLVVAFIANALLIEFRLISQIGASTFITYHIVGGLFSVTQGPSRPETLNQVISSGVRLGLWPVPGVPVPTTLTEVIDAGTTLGLWPSIPVPVTPTTLNEVIAAGTALNLWL